MNCLFPKKKRKIKLLVLGSSDSGKSTFMRQMRIIYGNGYTDKERMEHISLIYENVFNFMQNMIRAMEQLEIEYEKSENATKNATLIMNYANAENNTYLKDLYLSAIKELWNDSGIQACYKRRREYQLNDSTKYYLSNIDRIAEPDYIPNDQDILRMHVVTTGIIGYKFQVNNIEFRMTDVGGHRSERRKWMHCFDNVKAILFLVAISEYDQQLKEFEQRKERRNRLSEAKKVFESISNLFPLTPIILFLNKTDLFVEKIMYSHLKDFFPEFKGPQRDNTAAREFILNMFLQILPINKKNYSHFTCAINTENIKIVFPTVRDTVLTANICSFLKT